MTLHPAPRPDTEEIERFLALVVPERGIIEIRAFSAIELIPAQGTNNPEGHYVRKSGNPQFQRAGAIVGYFDDLKLAARAAASLNVAGAASVYFTLHELLPDLLARGKNRLAFKGKATEDGDVLHYRFFAIDCDTTQLTGMMANDGERKLTLDTCHAIRDYLGDQGFPEPLVLDSGNGYWLLYSLDPCPTSERALYERALKSLSALFSSAHCEIDPVVGNPSRLCALPGTVKMKGDHAPEVCRPHRVCRVMERPDDFGETKVTREQLEFLAASTPQVEAKAAPNTEKSGDTPSRAILLAGIGGSLITMFPLERSP